MALKAIYLFLNPDMEGLNFMSKKLFMCHIHPIGSFTDNCQN